MGPSYEYNAKVERIIDGDTIVARIELPFRMTVVHEFRLLGINCPELSPKLPKKGWNGLDIEIWEGTPGFKAKQYLVNRIGSAQVERQKLVLRTYKDSDDKYGRWLAEIFVSEDGKAWTNVNTELVLAGHAVPSKG
jgi:micrococcal nuclease